MRFLYCLLAVSLTVSSSLFGQSYPSYFALNSNSPVCDGQNFYFYVSYSVPPSGTQVSFRWSGPNGSINSSNNVLIIPASSSTTGVYSVTMTFTGTNQGSVTASKTVSLGPSKPMALVYDGQYTYPSRSICGPTSLSLVAYPDEAYSGNQASYTWTGPNGFTSTERNPVVSQGVSGLYILEATYPNNCGTGRDTLRIYDTSLFVYTAAYSVGSNGQTTNSYCPGESIAISAITFPPTGTTATFQWSGPNGFTSTSQSFTLANATTSVQGSYSVTATFSGNCTGTAKATQSIYIGPPIVPAGSFAYDANGTRVPAQTICPGSTFGVGAYMMGYSSSQATFRWSGPNGFTSNSDLPIIENATTAMSGVYSVTATTPTGCSGTNAVSVTVGTPSVTAYSSEVDSYGGSSINSFCPGSSFKLTASTTGSGSNYQWKGPNGFTSSASSITVTNATTAMSGPYSLTVTSLGGCSNTSTAQVTIGNATVTIGSNNLDNNLSTTSFCPGNTVRMAIISSTLYSASYQWRGPNGFTSNAESFTLTNVTPSMAGTYSVTATLPGGCVATGSRTIAIGQPAVNVSGNPYACNGGQLSLDAYQTINYNSSDVAATYQWSGPNGFTSFTKNFTLTNVTPAMAGTYSVTATFSGGCSGTATASTQVQVRKPSLNLFSQATNNQYVRGESYCPGTSFDVYPLFYQNSSNFPSNRSTVSYQWSGPNDFTSSIQQPTIPTASASSSGVYSVTVTVTGECSGIYTASREINIGPPRSIISTNPGKGAANNDSYCPGTIVGVNASNSPFTTDVISYQWRGPNGFTSTKSGFVLENINPANAGVYSLTTIYGGSCAGKRVEFTNIKVETPHIPIGVFQANGAGGPPSPLCVGNYYKLAPNALPYRLDSLALGHTFQWTLPDGSISNTPSLTITSASQANAGRYILTTTLGGVCASGISRDTVDLIVGIPAPRVWSSNLFITNGSSTTLFADQCAGPEVRWSDGQTGRSITVSPNQTTVYTAICYSSEGCLSPPSAPLTVRVSNLPEADLRLQVAVSNRTPDLSQPITVTLTVVNSSSQTAANVQIESRLPEFLTLVNAGNFQNNGGVLTTTLSSIPASTSVNQTVQLAATADGVFRLAAQIMSADNPDPDSYAGSGTNDGQDDMSWVDIRTKQSGLLVTSSPEPNPAFLPDAAIEKTFLPVDKVDLNLNVATSNVAPAMNEVITVTLQLGNYDDRRLLSPEVTCQLPTGLTFISGTNFVATGQQVKLTGGRYYECWPQTFSFQAQVTSNIAEAIKARISYCDWDDIDSSPENGFDTGEDDTAEIYLRVH